LSGELKKRSTTSTSANPDPDARTALPSLARETGTIHRFSLAGSRDQIEQARADRDLRKSRLQPDFRSRQGDFVASSPAYPGLARGAAGGAVTGGQPPDDCNPSRPLRSDSGTVETVDGTICPVP
jgi:hypothetical protein